MSPSASSCTRVRYPPRQPFLPLSHHAISCLFCLCPPLLVLQLTAAHLSHPLPNTPILLAFGPPCHFMPLLTMPTSSHHAISWLFCPCPPLLLLQLTSPTSPIITSTSHLFQPTTSPRLSAAAHLSQPTLPPSLTAPFHGSSASYFDVSPQPVPTTYSSPALLALLSLPHLTSHSPLPDLLSQPLLTSRNPPFLRPSPLLEVLS